jgi:ribosomal-protein-alanine N-acetyltransferase
MIDFSRLNVDEEKILETSRLTLEPITEKHAEAMFDVLQDNKIYKFIPETRPTSVLALRNRYRLLSRRRSPSDTQIWLNWVLRLKADGGYIGTIQATITDNDLANIAYVLSPTFWDRGYGLEATRKLVSLLFDEYLIDNVDAEVDVNNIRSQKLLEKLDFVKVRTSEINSDFLYRLHSSIYKP